MNLRTTILIAAVAAVCPTIAPAELRFCNHTGAKVQVAIAYVQKDEPGTTTNQHRGVTAEGWFSVAPGGCSTVSRIHVGNHWAYYFAEGGGRTWQGASMLCVPNSRFTTGVQFGNQGCGGAGRLRGFQRLNASTGRYTMNLNP